MSSDKPDKPQGLINRPSPISQPSSPDQVEAAEEEDNVPQEVMQPPAIFANGYYVTVSPTFARIAFSESTDGVPPIYRTSVLMGTEDARALAELIIRLSTELKTNGDKG